MPSETESDAEASWIEETYIRRRQDIQPHLPNGEDQSSQDGPSRNPDRSSGLRAIQCVLASHPAQQRSSPPASRRISALNPPHHTPDPDLVAIEAQIRSRDRARAIMARDGRKAEEEEQRAEVTVLQSRVEATALLTKRLQASMERLSTMGHNLTEAIAPIQSNTQDLQIIGKNIDSVLAAIDRIKKTSVTRNAEEDVIRAGPDKVGLSDFLASMGRIAVALRELKATNMRSNQEAIADLNKIIKSGNTQLESLFRRIVQEDTNPVEPLHFIIKEKPFPLLPQDKTAPLGLIIADNNSRASQFQEGDSAMAQIYAQERGSYVTFTLQNLAVASINTARKKSPDAVYRRGTNGIGMYASGIEGLFMAEYDNICALFPREEWGRVLSLTCQGALSELSKTLKDLNIHIKDNIATDCFLGFEIIEIISDLSFKIQSRTGELQEDFAQAAKPIRETCKLSLAELLEDIRRRVGAMQVLPNDGTPLTVVAEVMTRLLSLLDYSKPVTSIMTSLGDGNWKSINSANITSDSSVIGLDVGPDSDKLFAHYCTDTVDTLMSSIEQKGRSLLKGSNLMGTFFGNNVAVADRMIRTSDLDQIFRSRPPCIESWKKKALSLYMEVWKDTAHILLDTQPTARGARPPSGSSAAVDSSQFLKGLSSKEKDVIKDKFRNFNVTFDDNVVKHKALSMEREVREQFGKQVRLLVEPLYIRFFDRYHEIDKGKGKYVKYSKAEMAQVLMSLE